MKKLLTLSLFLLFAIIGHTQTTTEMLAWMNENSSKINLDKSTAKSIYWIKSITFSQNNVTLENRDGAKRSVGWASFDKVIKDGSKLTVQDLYTDYYLVLDISDPEYLKKYMEYIPKYAHTKLNTTAEDGPIYNKTQVDQAAVYPGGEQGWQKLLSHSFDHSPAFKYDVPPGTYKSEISFVVTETGFLKDFHRVTNNPKGIEDCLLKVLYRKSQPWIPAQINGKNVASKTSAKITIVVPKVDGLDEIEHYKGTLDLKLNMANY